ncbi:shikimate dehydrogenase [Chloroflexota bacterium]
MSCFNAVSGKTRVCGIIGDPVAHTMSPVMHNAAFRQLGLDYIYLAFPVKKTELERAIAGMRALNLRGLNVTIPHKVAVIPLLDKVDAAVGKIGAVNTIVNDDGLLTGYNTDAGGFLQALREKGFTPEGKGTVVLGAGGAARAISFVLAQQGARLTILNRTPERAEELAGWLSSSFPQEIAAGELNEKNLTAALTKASFLVNTTSVGMSPHDGESPVPQRLLGPSLLVFDIVYHPLQTGLLREAESAGARTIPGIEMLVGQGALAFTLWTGQPAPISLMKEEAIKALGYEK